jgi:CheY-like chemotaxis protein
VSHWGLPIQLTMARDGFDALLKIGERRPDVLITDLSMPGMDGFRLVAALRDDERYNSTGIVVVSGMSDSEIREGGSLPDDVAVLAKPIPFNDLRKIIENHLVN